jgi:predicted Zn-dependent protease
MALDPLDPVIPMRLAEFELKAQRPREAIATLRQALLRRPYSADLLNMAFYVALRQRDTALAGDVLDRGLDLIPDDGFWWERQYQLAVELGQAALARQSLAAALTADPESPTLNHAAWTLTQPAPAAPPARIAAP